MTGAGSRGSRRRTPVEGFVDERGRPLIKLQKGRQDLVVMVDTGFNEELLVEFDAARRFGVRRSQLFGDPPPQLTTIAGSVAVQLGLMDVEFGPQSHINVMILVDGKITSDGDAYGPEAIMGTKFLAKSELVIDFPASTVRISAA